MPFIRNSNFITPIHSYSCRHSAGEGFVSPSFTSSDYYRLCRAETYSYDSSDRLIQVDRNNSVYQTMEYDVNGNILSKTDVGTYNYDTAKRHAVTSIDVTGDKYSPGEQSVIYNFFGKVETIGEWNGDKYHELNITYGPDMERCKSVLSTNHEEKRTIIYSDSYECVTENGQTREFYYIGENVILVRQTGKSDIVCHAITDNQGSILCIVDDDGKRLFEAAYDAWGKQEEITNTIGFLRGYTGHEMLPEFGLINMNHLIKREQSELACYAERENGRMKFSGRVYDPTLGRFLSPDNYVQMPDNTQSFNRYSYCINNPLKYVDPSGEFWHLVAGAVFGGIFNWAMHGFQLNASGLGYFAVGAMAGAASSAMFSGISATMANGSFWAGAAGSGVSATGIFAGAASSAGAGFAGGFITTAGNSWVEGHGFGAGLVAGLKSGSAGALAGGITGGITGGLDAWDKDLNIWTGKAKLDLSGACSFHGTLPSDLKVGEETVTGKYVGKFEGVNVYETERLGSIITPKDGYYNYRAVTIPERGIIAAEGVFTSGKKYGRAMMQHEFGHILQHRDFGAYAYWHIVAPESLASATFSPSSHYRFWTETWANYLAKEYFGKMWLGGARYPAKNISPFNMYRMIATKIHGLMPF